jgi:hypothetical protein
MTARLVRGNATLNLDSGRFSIADGCRPPSIQREYNLAAGSAANTLGGADVVSSKASNRDWTFIVRDLGSSVADVESGARAISNFLMGAGDASTPTYFEFKTDNLPIPLWGQFGAPLRFEVVTGYAELGAQYDSAHYLRARGIEIAVTLTIKPVAVGFHQRLATAMGGILEDTIGAVDGTSRGLIIPPITYNLVRNPVLVNGTTNWAVGTGMVLASSDEQQLVTGMHSAKVVKPHGAAGTTLTFDSGIVFSAGSSYYVSCFIRRRDGAAITGTDVPNMFVENTSVAVRVIRDAGNGWYRVASSARAASGSTSNCGIYLAEGSYYVALPQCETNYWDTPAGYGDMLGWSWTGTAHASASLRAAGSARLPVASDTIDLSNATIRVVWKTPYDNTYARNMFLFSTDGATRVYALFRASDDEIVMTDGTNSVASAAQTFAVDTWMVLHFVFTSGRMEIWRDGVRIANGATYTQPSGITYLYLGSDGSGGVPCFGPFTAAVFDAALTTAQIQADYANIAPILARGERVEAIPWLWTKDGDDIVDNYYDATHNNFFICGGIPGSLPADYRLAINHQQAADPYGENQFCLSNLDLDVAINPNFLFYDQSGSAGSGLVGGQELVSSKAAMAWLDLSTNILASQERYLEGREIFTLVRVLDAGSGSLAWAGVTVAGSNVFSSAVVPFSAAHRTVVILPPYIVPKVATPLSLINLAPAVLSVRAMLGRQGTTHDFSVDFYTIMPSPLMVIDQPYATWWASKMLVHDGVIDHYRGSDSYPSTLFDYQYTGSYRGRWVDLLPGRINHLFVMGMAGTYLDTTITHVFTITGQVAPRWGLL